MSANCHVHSSPPSAPQNGAFRRVLWFALAVNGAMFGLELAAAQSAGSVALLADSVDFFGDAANYGLSLFVLSMSLAARSRAALFKGVSMLAFAVWVVGQAAWNVANGVVPEPLTMGAVGFLALAANAAVALALFAHRTGDSNRRSVWLCTRNDVIGNLAVMLAAAGVFGSGTGWPDIAVAAIMAFLALQGGWQVLRLARGEIRQSRARLQAAE